MDDTWQVEAGGLMASWMGEAEGLEQCQEAINTRDWGEGGDVSQRSRLSWAQRGRA